MLIRKQETALTIKQLIYRCQVAIGNSSSVNYHGFPFESSFLSTLSLISLLLFQGKLGICSTINVFQPERYVKIRCIHYANPIWSIYCDIYLYTMNTSVNGFSSCMDHNKMFLVELLTIQLFCVFHLHFTNYCLMLYSETRLLQISPRSLKYYLLSFKHLSL